ncbi:MAG: diguanylate cyclase [Legionellaceae bacterium]|nr:diguanylate cyclase [Legionellaceae bacterium]
MKLSTFIVDNIEPILQEWENFAITIFPENQKINIKELRDHAKQMLMRIVTDMDKPQSKLEQTKKSKGLSLRYDKDATPAEEHGSARLAQGYSMNNLIAEFRALRASTIKLFSDAGRIKLLSDPYDLVRFNEAIDQALSESVAEYTLVKEKQIRHFNKMISGGLDLHYILDLEGNIIYMNTAMSELYPTSPHEILGKAIYNFEMPNTANALEHIQHIIRTGQSCEGELSYKDDLGNEHFYKYKFEPIFDDNGTLEAIAGVSREITEQKLSEKQIWYNANYDLLTGLANRLMFNDKLTQAIKDSKRSGESIALLFIDLDGFKKVNDTLGHVEADLLLKKIAKIIDSCVRETDTASRIGGDEFTVILNGVQDAQQTKIVAEKLLSELRKPFKLNKNTFHITASIGITMSPQDSLTPDVLLRNADQAMYASKKSGGDCCIFWGVKSNAME